MRKAEASGGGPGRHVWSECWLAGCGVDGFGSVKGRGWRVCSIFGACNVCIKLGARRPHGL